MYFEVIAFAINMICVVVFATRIMEKQLIYTINCTYHAVRLSQENETAIKNLYNASNEAIESIKNHAIFFRISIPGFSLGILFTYCLQQQEQISYIAGCVLPTIIMVAVGAIIFAIHNKINSQNTLTSQDISIDMSFSALIFAGCILSINKNAAVLAASIVIGRYAAFDLIPEMKNTGFHFKEVIKLLKLDLYGLQKTMFIGYLALYWSLFIVTSQANSKEEYFLGLLSCVAFFTAALVLIDGTYRRNMRHLQIQYRKKENPPRRNKAK